MVGLTCVKLWMKSFTDQWLIRLGRVAHIVFMILCLINNIFACANMLLGASAVITAMYTAPDLFREIPQMLRHVAGPGCISSQQHSYYL
jgi:hypothetical protein